MSDPTSKEFHRASRMLFDSTLITSLIRTDFSWLRKGSSPYNSPRRHAVGVEVKLYSSFNLGDRWGGWSTPRSAASPPPGKNRYPLYWRLGGCQDLSGRVRKVLPPTGIQSPDRSARSESLFRLSYPASLRQGSDETFSLRRLTNFFYCCTVNFVNIKILFTNKCTLLLNI